MLLDGATGTNFFEMGLPAGEAPELWNVKEPDHVASLYESSVKAGADVFLTNSFGSNWARLRLHDASSDARLLSRIAAELGREVSDRHGGKTLVAGSIGPTGELMEPMGSLTPEAAEAIFSEQAHGLKDGGADLLWVETISDLAEFSAAAKACASTGLLWCGTMSFDTAGRTMMGVCPSGLSEVSEAMTCKPLAVGANCGAGAADLVRSLLRFADAGCQFPIIAKGNAGIPKFSHGQIHYDGSPELMADYAELARNAGAAFIGGCCGTAAGHVEQMRIRLENSPIGQRPGLKEIVAKLGAFSSEECDSIRPARVRRSRNRVRGAAGLEHRI